MRLVRERNVAQLMRSALQLALWIYVYVTLMLGGWILMGWTVSGWSPVVITSGSMEPTLSAGDVLLVDTGPDVVVGQRSIALFARDGEAIAHRVFAVDGDELVTKGDANATPDLQPVRLDAVDGIGRLVVPFIGLPLVWLAEGSWLLLAAWLVVALGAAGQIAMSAERAFTRLRHRQRVDSANAASVQIGVQRVRLLMAILITAEAVVGGDRLAGVEHGGLLTAGAVATLLATNSLGIASARRGATQRHIAATELAIDTLLAVVLAMSTGSTGLSWVLFALPIVEAAFRFRLSGAMVHWMLLTCLALAANVWATTKIAPADVLGDLKATLDQLMVLFLVVVPAGYLVEHLLGEVAGWQRATGLAEHRSQLLVRVADVGRDVARLDDGSDPVAALLDGVRSLGFARADIVAGDGETWRVIAGDELPAPARAGSGLEACDLDHPGVFVDRFDDGCDDAARAALAELDLSALLAHQVTADRQQAVVVRAGLRAGERLSLEHVEAFRLLVAQAVVALRNGQLLTEVTNMHDELEYRAHHDALTGLPNRALLLDRLRGALVHRPVVFFLDLNGFKPVNDRLGHDVGDVLLRMVAERLPAAVPDDATVARLGGDEFTVVVPRALAEADALEVARSIIEIIRRPFDVGREDVVIGTSIGISFGTEGTDEAELIRRADVAMYRAKHSSEAGLPIELYRADFDDESKIEAAKVASFAEALSDGSVRVVFQPIVDIGADPASPVLVGAEALVRWLHPEFGFVPPPQVIEVAQKADLAPELLAFIAGQACHAARRWQRLAPEQHVFVSVNVSPADLEDPDAAEIISEAAARAGLPVDRLHIEISENMISPPSPQVADNIAALDEVGIGLLLDDFGQGNVSLSYLHQLPLAGLKLDRSLVVNAARSADDRVVLQSVTDLAHRLDLIIVAEGVEDHAQLTAVTAADCRLIQGYLFAKPGPPEAVEAMLLVQRAARAATSSLPSGFPTPSIDALAPAHGRALGTTLPPPRHSVTSAPQLPPPVPKPEVSSPPVSPGRPHDAHSPAEEPSWAVR